MNVVTNTRRVTGTWDAGSLPTILDIQDFLSKLTAAGVDPGIHVAEITSTSIVVEWPVA
jgi:hypothetical protein